ncbi:MAG TPA: hypothetical protein VGI68_20270 [Mycobacterium sp.]|jgi:hypothetical protein
MLPPQHVHYIAADNRFRPAIFPAAGIAHSASEQLKRRHTVDDGLIE